MDNKYRLIAGRSFFLKSNNITLALQLWYSVCTNCIKQILRFCKGAYSSNESLFEENRMQQQDFNSDFFPHVVPIVDPKITTLM